ncbi:MAG: GtrA family protein [Actinobacteria bacterium]|nr:GtrA family protein [Actinomycetota bacterium]
MAEGDPGSTGAAEPGTSRPELRLVLLFLAIGAATTILHLGAFAALREQWSAQWSNTAALAVATVANTWANRRWTFGVTGAKGAATHQLQGFLVFALTWTLTSGGLHLLAAEWPGAPRWVEVAAVAVATFTSTAVKYVLMRYWMFRRIVSNPRRGSHRPH